jgi:Domain of Unknown Function (DUF1540)
MPTSIFIVFLSSYHEFVGGNYESRNKFLLKKRYLFFTGMPSLLSVHARKKEVKGMALDVLCEVANCVHNRNGKNCGADEIYVVSHQGNKARNSEETDCKTFEPGTL